MNNNLSEKKQIILCHSGREVSEYLTSLDIRINFNRIPHYVIDQNGNIHNILENSKQSKLFSCEIINSKSIVVCLENLGWLEKKPLSNEYINWKGNIYNGKVYEKKWRDYFFWHPYSDEQVEKTAFLCLDLMDKYKINKNIISNNVKIDYIKSFEGVVSRSNYSTRYTDLNPSFDFIKFGKIINNG